MNFVIVLELLKFTYKLLNIKLLTSETFVLSMQKKYEQLQHLIFSISAS